MTNALDMLAQLGVTAADVDAHEDRQKNSGPTDRRICLCGHPINRHKIGMTTENPKGVPWKEGPVAAGEMVCKPNGLTCGCRNPDPVLLVSDSRTFLRVTSGGGASHALFKGMRSANPKTKLSWIVTLKCAFCNAVGDDYKIHPMPLTKSGKISPDGTSHGYDNFLCVNCRGEIL